MSNRSLWKNTDGSDRHFLLPDDADLPAGDLEIRTKLGRTLRVDEAAAGAYEVTKEEAKEWAMAELRGLGAEVERKLEQRRQRRRRRRTEPPASLSLLSALSGERADALRRDPDALRRGLKKIGDDLLDALKAGPSQNPEQIAAARAKLEAMREALERHDPASRKSSITKGGSDDEGAPDAARASVLAGLADFARSLAELSQTAADRLEDAADELRTQRSSGRGVSGHGGTADPDSAPPSEGCE